MLKMSGVLIGTVILYMFRGVVSEKVKLSLDGINLKSSKNSNATHLYYNFNGPEEISMKCHINKQKYTVMLLDEESHQGVSLGIRDSKNTTVTYNFTLENSDRIFICKAVEYSQKPHNKNQTTQPRGFIIKVYFYYKPNTYTTDRTTITAGTATTASTPAKDPDFLKEHWPIIAICCAVVLIICVVACLVKVLCTRNKSQPPDDYVNLTSDRAVNYPAQTAPNRTMPKIQPKIQSNYCNPKDLQTGRNNIEPNYSEVKESQGMGEGLYAELNRPEDTYAEPYIDKNELYAQPIPKAERRKKDDPSYGNVFGQDYVNSNK